MSNLSKLKLGKFLATIAVLSSVTTLLTAANKAEAVPMYPNDFGGNTQTVRLQMERTAPNGLPVTINITRNYGLKNYGLLNTWTGNPDSESLYNYITNGYAVNFQSKNGNYSISVPAIDSRDGARLNTYSSGFGRYQDWNIEKLGGQYGDTYLFHWRADINTNLCLDIRGFAPGQRLSNEIPGLSYCDGNNPNQRVRVIKQGAAPQITPVVGLPSSASQANVYFKTQYYNNQWNPDGPSSSQNCGPASVAMIVKLFGKELSNNSVQTSINRARQLMNAPMNSNIQTDNVQIVAGLSNVGLRSNTYSYNANTFAQIDRDLADGKAVIAFGYYGNSWRNQFPSYSLTGSGNTNHINTILGKTSSGNYLVGDPMYRGGVVEMNRNQLAVFFSYNGGLHISIARQ